MFGGSTFAKFIKMYCTPILDDNGNIINGQYTINPETKPSKQIKYGSRNGRKLKKMWPAGKPFSMSLLSS